jgi:regulator of protease activity HflC (stomatin/prohibitin superfamily)
VCGRYTAEDFFLARGEIQSAMLNQTAEDLAQSDAHVTIGSVQISNIDLPDDFVSAINRKQLAIQESERYLSLSNPSHSSP